MICSTLLIYTGRLAFTLLYSTSEFAGCWDPIGIATDNHWNGRGSHADSRGNHVDKEEAMRIV
eukprot:4904543-Pyramimonas_sp.AAC.1